MRHLKSRGLGGVRMFISDACLGLVEEVSLMLKAIHASESKGAARAKAKEVVKRLKEMRLGSAARWVERGVEETLTYYGFPSSHWRRVRTNNPRGP